MMTDRRLWPCPRARAAVTCEAGRHVTSRGPCLVSMGTAPMERTPTMARISLDPPRTPLYRLAEWYSRRSYGVVADPLAAMGHNLRVLITDPRFETRWRAGRGSTRR